MKISQLKPMIVGLVAAIGLLLLVRTGSAESQTKESTAGKTPSELTIVVMDPLSAPLSCPCVEGYAQRDYQQLADYLSQKLELPTKVVFHESLTVALKEKTKGQASLVIGKDSVVRSDAKRAKLKLQPVVRLTGKDGLTTQTGLIIVRSGDPAQNLSDLRGYRFLFGPDNCDEKHGAAAALLESAGVEMPDTIETSAACSDGACKIIEWGDDVRAATVISSYAKPLLEGCGTISKGDLRVIGETKPVPFVTAFVDSQLPQSMQKRLEQALLSVGKQASLLTALETLTGFVPMAPEEKKAAMKPAAEKSASKAMLDKHSQADPVIPTDDLWPSWRGRHRDGHCGWLPNKLPQELQIVWKQSLAGPGLGGVAATQEYVIIGDRDLRDLGDLFRCYSASDGEPLWTFSHPTIGRLDYGNTPRATPLVHGDHVYLHGAFGDLHCLDLATGDLVWQKNFALNFGTSSKLPWGTCGSPLIVDGKLIVNPGSPDASLAALDPSNGEVLWQTPGAESAYGSFIAGQLGGVHQIVGHDAKTLGGWEVATGKRLWSLVPENQEDFSVPTPMIVGNRLLVTSENNGTRLFEFDQEGRVVPEPIAVNTDLASDTGTPVVVGSRVYSVWNDLHCLDLKDQLKTRWTKRDPSYQIYGSLLAYGDRLLVSAASGELLLLDTQADQCKFVSRLQVFDTPNAELYSHPAMVGSRLFLRGENALVCVELSRAAVGKK